MKVSVKPVEIKQRVSRLGIIRFQIHAWCSLRGIQVTNADLDMLALLSVVGKVRLSDFCQELTKTELSSGIRVKRLRGRETEFKYIFNSKQSARNAISKATGMGLISKDLKSHFIFLNPDMKIYTNNNLLIDYKLLCIEPDKG